MSGSAMESGCRKKQKRIDRHIKWKEEKQKAAQELQDLKEAVKNLSDKKDDLTRQYQIEEAQLYTFEYKISSLNEQLFHLRKAIKINVKEMKAITKQKDLLQKKNDKTNEMLIQVTNQLDITGYKAAAFGMLQKIKDERWSSELISLSYQALVKEKKKAPPYFECQSAIVNNFHTMDSDDELINNEWFVRFADERGINLNYDITEDLEVMKDSDLVICPICQTVPEEDAVEFKEGKEVYCRGCALRYFDGESKKRCPVNKERNLYLNDMVPSPYFRKQILKNHLEKKEGKKT